MTRVFPRTSFHSSKLIRCLADLDMVDAVEPGDRFAEKLGLWVNFADAIALSAVHSEGPCGPASGAASRAEARSASRAESEMQPAMRAERQPAEHLAIAAEFDKIQAALVSSITRSFTPSLGKTHIKLPTPMLELPLDLRAAYAPYGRFYEAHGRDMEMTLQPLRVNVRAALAKASPKLRKLAELDAMFEAILQAREKQLLSKVPALLRKRFDQLFGLHQQKLIDTWQSDVLSHWTRPGGWLARFCSDMQMLLLAEMELRLQPTLGLVEAFNDATK
ncbi:MAG: hypothetical protein JWR21_1014 [Herminiimonas sp.]|nr:hypothetical protein [Herminiimonas sp.]